MPELTDHHRRVLCELIGECRHEETFDEEIDCYRCSCGMRFSIEGQLHGHIQNDNEYRTRTFTTWADYGRCVEVIIASGLLTELLAYLIVKRERELTAFCIWGWWERMTPAARCREIAEFVIQRKEKG